MCAAGSLALAAGCVSMRSSDGHASSYLKGNLHTHTLWSDGDDYPEMVAESYKKNGYHFLAISDHNVMLEGEKWVEVKNTPNSLAAFSKYRARHGTNVVVKLDGGKTMVRLSTLAEFAPALNEPGRFLMIPGEEITAEFEKHPVHLNATNLREFIPPRPGTNVADVIQKNVNAVLEQREATGQAMFPHVNHPNFWYAVTTEDLMAVQGEKFFEVYNGHPAVNNGGDALRPGTERMWDIILAFRLGVLNLGPMYGIATDDSHHYHGQSRTLSNSSRGWVMVKSPKLEAEAIVHAMERGDFYASTGVRLSKVECDGKTYRVEVEDVEGVEYAIQFIGTRRGFDASSTEVADQEGKAVRTTRKYSDQIGQILKTKKGAVGVYSFKGDELYVRALVVSSRAQINGISDADLERAWTQPFSPAGKAQKAR